MTRSPSTSGVIIVKARAEVATGRAQRADVRCLVIAGRQAAGPGSSIGSARRGGRDRRGTSRPVFSRLGTSRHAQPARNEPPCAVEMATMG